MEKKDILEFCIRKGLLVDKELLALLSEEGDQDSVKLILENIKNYSGKKFITKSIFIENKEQVSKVFEALPEENKKKLEKLKIKLGLSIEISKEVEESVSEDSLEGSVKVLSMNFSKGQKFTVNNFVDSFKERFFGLRAILQERPELDNLISINKISGNRQGISLIGMVLSKRVTKNKNLIFEIEDLTGKTKVLINSEKEELYKKAEDVALDSVVGFKCSGNREILFVNDIVFPDSFLLNRKYAPLEEYALFIGDVHYGSKNFMSENFLKFIDYLNGKFPNTPEVSKIKYLFIIGDLITGVGNYPNQEKDLAIPNLEDQFNGIADLLERIRKDIKIIISPGNHEGVRLMEPQPLYDEKYAWRLYDMENVYLTENPAIVNIAGGKNFSGFNVLTYHGFSYFYYVNNVPKLTKAKAANCPETIMQYLLKQRHLAPTYGSVQYFPNGKDVHLIREVPDIFVSGHTHKSAVTYYNNILVISTSSWESQTPYQEKFGNNPDHCKIPMLNLKTRAIKILDFE